MCLKILLGVIVFCLVLHQISCHGMMMDPPNRSSLWRFDPEAPPNYNDDQNYCGGFNLQWQTFNGKCGVCGDPYDAVHPQDNENTGIYGQGKVVQQYVAGSVIPIMINLTANHKGYFNFSICVLEDVNAPESGEDCFQPISLANGSSKYNVSSEEDIIDLELQLPAELKCERCVLRWHYNAGNNWGQCEDGSWATGCGPQETFRSCSDIAIA